MARCYLTGVEFRVDDGNVINRSDAHRLLRTLKRRSESLERIIAQLSPLDVAVSEDARATNRPRSRQHRMICKAVADALAPAYPEIELFLSWTALRALRTRVSMRLLKDHPVHGAAISRLSDADLVPVAILGREVLRLIDPGHKLSLPVQVAIRAGICVRHRTKSAQDIAALIRSTIRGGSDLAALGVPEEEHNLVRSSLEHVLCAPMQSISHHERR